MNEGTPAPAPKPPAAETSCATQLQFRTAPISSWSPRTLHHFLLRAACDLTVLTNEPVTVPVPCSLRSSTSVPDSEPALYSCELSVLIIILRLFLSVTSMFRLSNTVFIVSTTRWKLLAAPRSCVSRTIDSGCFLPCSITATISAANSTSFIFRSSQQIS